MSGLAQFWAQSDGIGRAVAALLLAMSVSAWVLILWKAFTLRRARADIARGTAAFWAADSAESGRSHLAAFDREGVLLPLLDAVATGQAGGSLAAGVSLATRGSLETQLTRRLRDALHRALAQLQFGQVVLASVGSTAPFVGLFGTVWAIYHALAGIAAAGAISIDRVAGPVGEALVMTAAGLAVAIPAVLAFNLFGQWVAACEGELEGFAHDLRQMTLDNALEPG